MILSGRWFLGCTALGAALGFGMVFMHTGPGIIPPVKPDTPQERNQARTQDLETIAQALESYKKDHGSLPLKLGPGSTEICSTIGADCAASHKIDLGFLINSGQYLTNIPRDPGGSNREWSTGYLLAQLPDGTFRLNATKAELGKTIELTR